MKTTPHIVFHGVDSSPALTERIHQQIAQLDGQYDRITACRVVIEKPHHHHRHGNHFGVKIELTVPGQVLAVTHDPPEHTAATDAYAAVNDAFATMERQLDTYQRKQRGE